MEGGAVLKMWRKNIPGRGNCKWVGKAGRGREWGHRPITCRREGHIISPNPKQAPQPPLRDFVRVFCRKDGK